MSVRDDVSPAYQLRRYAWSAKLPLGILTDFEEFAVFDCRVRPNSSDKASAARTMYLTYDQYPQRWQELAAVFGREAVLRGSFDRYVESNRAKRGTAEVDAAFLQEISSWRDELARNLALRNPALTSRELNFAVQQSIDRVIFLRIAEDRGLEPYGRLLALVNGGQVYERLCDLYRQADERYNSGLFHFRQEKGRAEAPDLLSYSLRIDDKVLATIVKKLYYPESPYEFSVLPVEILGQVYEQFLGKVIRLTAGHQAKVEEKPEVKKAGGVYYTPTYIVDYIVEHTVGALCEGKTPAQVTRLRVLDPACGSGSFLLGAYEYLLHWHLDWYRANDPERWARRKEPPIYMTARAAREGAEPSWELTIAERKRILLDNIHGVDIDAQAVEVTKLSLLLKVLEGETATGAATQLAFLHERALPDLGSNIKCGNSLIGSDYYEGRQAAMFDAEAERVNAFDWRRAFPHVFAAGGFDAVIGNPPYVLLQSLHQPHTEAYLSRAFRAAAYKIDTYHLFVEQGLRLATRGGYLAYITPNSFLRNKHARPLRDLMLESSEIRYLRLFFYPVFQGASVDTAIFVCQKTPKPAADHRVTVLRSDGPNQVVEVGEVVQGRWAQHPDRHFEPPAAGGSDALLAKIDGSGRKLGDIATAYFGIQTYDRAMYVRSAAQAASDRPVVDGGAIGRYSLQPSVEYVDFRPASIKSGGKSEVYEQDRIGVRQIGRVPVATLLPAGLYTLNTVYNVFVTVSTPIGMRFLLGILLSKVVAWYWEHRFFDQKRTFPKVKKEALLQVPLPVIDFADPADGARHDRMVGLVERMLALHEQVVAAKVPAEKEMLQRQIEVTDRQIDQLVYELYGLTDDEIAIVEGEGR